MLVQFQLNACPISVQSLSNFISALTLSIQCKYVQFHLNACPIAAQCLSEFNNKYIVNILKTFLEKVHKEQHLNCQEQQLNKLNCPDFWARSCQDFSLARFMAMSCQNIFCNILALAKNLSKILPKSYQELRLERSWQDL